MLCNGNRNGSYTWTEKSYNVANNNILTASADDLITYTYELQVCGPVKSSNPACKNTSAINRVNNETLESRL